MQRSGGGRVGRVVKTGSGNTWHGISSENDESLKRPAVHVHSTGKQRDSQVFLGGCSGAKARAGVGGCEARGERLLNGAL